VTIPMSISMMAIVRGVIEVSVVSECQHAGKLTTSRTRKSQNSDKREPQQRSTGGAEFKDYLHCGSSLVAGSGYIISANLAMVQAV